MSSKRVVAPSFAKVNLGLEVLGRRADGYHDIITILHEIDLHDDFAWSENGGPFEYVGPREVDGDLDLVWRALRLAPDRDRWTGELRLMKRIPLAAGLGGGSSNAAAALRLAFPAADSDELLARAATLGSDVPFFIDGGTALATGTGTTLTKLPTPKIWFVIVVPKVELPAKTASMYRSLTSEDFTDGARVLRIAEAIRSGTPLRLLAPSAFLNHPPNVEAFNTARQWMLDALGQCAMSGAGPALFATYPSRSKARAAERLLPAEIGRVIVCSSLASRPTCHLADLQRALRGTMQE